MRRTVALIAGVVTGFSFGSAAILIRFLPHVDSNSIAFTRLFIGFWILLLILHFRKRIKQLYELIKEYRLRPIVMGVLLGLHFIFFTASVKHTTVLHATIFVNTVPIQALVLSILIYRLKPSRRELLAVVLGFTGILIIALTEFATLSGNIIGDLEALLAATFIAIYLNIGANLRKKVDAEVLMVSNFMLGYITIFIYSLPIQGGIHVPLELLRFSYF